MIMDDTRMGFFVATPPDKLERRSLTTCTARYDPCRKRQEGWPSKFRSNICAHWVVKAIICSHAKDRNPVIGSFYARVPCNCPVCLCVCVCVYRWEAVRDGSNENIADSLFCDAYDGTARKTDGL